MEHQAKDYHNQDVFTGENEKISILRRLNIRLIIYLDDVLLMAESISELLIARDTLIFLLFQWPECVCKILAKTKHSWLLQTHLKFLRC